MTTPQQPRSASDSSDAPNDEAPTPRPRSPRISQANVFAAADALLVMGARPTIDRVRMKLGRGSPNTINDHLDAWWAKLGARLRDLPGQEFPQLPQRVAHTLQQLWNEALTGAHESLQATLLERDQSLLQRETALQQASHQLAERERETTARAAAQEESLALAREQLSTANQRAQALEKSVDERDKECSRLRARIETLEMTATDLRAKLDAASAAHRTERTQLQDRYTAAETHWLREVDRARQQNKETAKEHHNQVKELRQRAEALQAERDDLRQTLLQARADLKTAVAVREQLEARLRATQHPAPASKQHTPPKHSPRTRKPRRPRAPTSDTERSK